MKGKCPLVSPVILLSMDNGNAWVYTSDVGRRA